MDKDLTETQTRAWEFLRAVRKGSPAPGYVLHDIIKVERESHPGAAVRAVIHALRVKGYPICATGKGYYSAHDQAELDEYRQSLRERAQSVMDASRGLEMAQPVFELKAQETIWEL